MTQYISGPLMETGADPWIIQKDGLYYYCFSDNKSSIFISCAADPHHLDQAEKILIWRAPAGKPYSHETWAPELHALDGLWYVYFAASDGDNSTHRMYVLEADQPLGPYRFKGQITPESDRWAIDATVLEMDDGVRYLIWSGWDGTTNIQQNLYIARMENPWTLRRPVPTTLPLQPLPDDGGALLHAEVFAETAGFYSLEITYSCETSSMHRLELNDETHYGLHYHPTNGHAQTCYEKIELVAGRNVLRLSPGIGSALVRSITVRAYGQDRLLLSAPEFPWEKLGGPPYVNEGPQILKRDGRIHIVYSASASWTDDYRLGLLTFQGGDILDRRNWIKKGPVFQGTESVFGPGHASFISFKERDWIVYHAAKHSGAGWNRQVCMQPFHWDEVGDPFFGSPWPLADKVQETTIA